jgi:hypothetical protein
VNGKRESLEIALDVVYDGVLKKFDKIWCGKGLIAIRSNLLVTWKDGPKMGIIT